MKAVGLLVLGTVVFAGGSGVARADGPPGVPYAPPRAYAPYEPVYVGYDWSGYYVGGHLGAAFMQSDWTIPVLGPIEHSGKSFAGGAQIGLQKQWGRVVAGIEVSYTALDADITSHTLALGVAPATRTSEISNLLLVTGRVGWTNDNLLAYAKGGFASGDVDISFTAPALSLAGSASDRANGWTAGVGLEYAIRDNIILGVEYNYVRLNLDDRALNPSGLVVSDAGVDVQSILARVSFKFDYGRGLVPVK